MSKPVLEIKNLSVRYGAVPAITDVSLRVNEGDYVGIIGPNGGGKTTLLKAVLGLVKSSAGTVEKNLSGEALSYVPQHSNLNRSFPITVREAVVTGRLKGRLNPFHRYSRRDYEAADDALSRIGISSLAQRQISQLSGGEFQKMLIARALTVKPKLLLLDEPTANIDSAASAVIYSLLEELNKEMTIIMVTHDFLAIASNIKEVACLNHSLVYHGRPELTFEVVENLYGCPVDLIAHGVPHRVLKKHSDEEGCCK